MDGGKTWCRAEATWRGRANSAARKAARKFIAGTHSHAMIRRSRISCRLCLFDERRTLSGPQARLLIKEVFELRLRK